MGTESIATTTQTLVELNLEAVLSAGDLLEEIACIREGIASSQVFHLDAMAEIPHNEGSKEKKKKKKELTSPRSVALSESDF